MVECPHKLEMFVFVRRVPCAVIEIIAAIWCRDYFVATARARAHQFMQCLAENAFCLLPAEDTSQETPCVLNCLKEEILDLKC